MNVTQAQIDHVLHSNTIYSQIQQLDRYGREDPNSSIAFKRQKFKVSVFELEQQRQKSK